MTLWDDFADVSEHRGKAASPTPSTSGWRPRARTAAIAAVGVVLVLALWASLSALAGVGTAQRSVADDIAANRETLRHLGAQFDHHELGDGTPVPEPLRRLSRDGLLHVQRDYLYLSVWQDWREERGTGIAYFPTPPDPRRAVPTAAGDDGFATRDLGDGWWTIE